MRGGEGEWERGREYGDRLNEQVKRHNPISLKLYPLSIKYLVSLKSPIYMGVSLTRE